MMVVGVERGGDVVAGDLAQRLVAGGGPGVDGRQDVGDVCADGVKVASAKFEVVR